jgi:pilus assembly protein CpaE
MNAYANTAFKSSRSAAAPVPEQSHLSEPQAVAQTSVLVISTSAVVLEHFEQAAASDDTSVTTRNATLAGLLADQGLAAFDHDIIMFEMDGDDGQQMDALREISGAWAGRARFMALTAENLSLAQARVLIDAGVEDVIPMATLLPAPTAEPAQVRPHEAPDKSAQGKIIIVAKSRGGVGATTTAVNLAQALLVQPRKGRKPAVQNRVALVDLDIQNGALGSYLDVADGGGVIEMLRAGELPDTTQLRRAMVAHPNGLSVLPAPTEFAPVDAMTAPMISAMLENLRQRFEYIVIDLPMAILPSLSVLLAAADRVLLVTDTSVPSIRNAHRLVTLFSEHNFSLPVEIVVTHEAKPFTQSRSLKEAVALLGRPFAHWIPRDDRAARRAIDLGKPLAIVAAGSAMTKAYRRLADDVIVSNSSAKTTKD